MMRAAPAKFLFENDFAVGGDRKPAVNIDEHRAKLREAEEQAFQRGFAQGKTDAEAEAAQRSAAALEAVAATLLKMDKSLHAVEARLETEAVEVAVAVARKLAPALIARAPFTEIAALAIACFRNLVKTPHVAVRVNDALLEVTREKLDEIAHRCGLDSRLVVLAEPDLAPGDCRIEWADGGINRDRAAIAAAIEEAVARYVQARLAALGDTPETFMPESSGGKR
jgi:flagellar assembly protein FliH